MKAPTAPSGASDVIESIVQLTEQRDQHSLEQSLITTLAELLNDTDGWLLDLPTHTEEAHAKDLVMLYGKKSRLPKELLEQVQHLPENSLSQQIRIDNRQFLVAKLTDTRQSRYNLLILAKPEWENHDLKLVKGMIQVYQNFIAVLYDSEKDTLTGLYNRRKLDAKLKELIETGHRDRRHDDGGRDDFLALLDLDRFKRINDTFGHLIGDEVLLSFTGILRRTLRDNDMLFRYGGEEFVVLLRSMTLEDAQTTLDRLRKNVEAFVFPQVGNVTVSIGYAPLDRQALPVQTIENADRALYYAKDNGRNQIQSYTQLVAEGKLGGGHQEGSIELF
jgi:diguanylate cyclase (GGDEF)-like protein